MVHTKHQSPPIKMVQVSSFLLATLVATLSPLSVAEKDNTFYGNEVINPNINNKMYWRDARNVLEDLSQFSALYIKHHGCVYSRYGHGSNAYTDDDDDDGGGGGNDGDDDGICGGSGSDTYWYMGKTVCFKANSAYSLYGVLKSEMQGYRRGSMCHKATYIDTYFTTMGVATIGGPLGLLGDDYKEEKDDEQDNAERARFEEDEADNEDAQNDEDGENGEVRYPSAECVNGGEADCDNNNQEEHNQQMCNYGEMSSFGTGCSAGKYVLDRFEGSFCFGENAVETIDTFDEFNEGMDSLDCEQIFDGSNYANDGEDAKEDDGAYGIGPQILKYSTSCDIFAYPSECQDPYGIKAKYIRQLNKALATKAAYKPGSRPVDAIKPASFGLLASGLFLMISACCLRKRAYDRANRVDTKYSHSAEEERVVSRPDIFIQRVSSTISKAASSAKESVQNYCEEDEGEVDDFKEEYTRGGSQATSNHDRSVTSPDVEAEFSTPTKAHSVRRPLPVHAGAGSFPPAPRKKKRPLLAKFSNKVLGPKTKRYDV